MKGKNNNQMTEKDIKHLEFIYNRMHLIHNENENYDYMIKFKEIIKELKKPQIDYTRETITTNQK